MRPLNSILALCIGITFVAFVGACNNNKGRGANTGANIGAIPTPTCLLSPTGYQGQCNFNYGAYAGFMNYDYTYYGNGLNNNYANGFCGCAQGGYPVYQNNWGLGCVNANYLPQQNYGGYGNPQFVTYFWNVQTLQWINTQQSYANNGYYAGYGQCQKTVMLACDTGVQGSCGPNAICMSLNQSTGNGYSQSGPGLCVLNQSNYYNPYYY